MDSGSWSSPSGDQDSSLSANWVEAARGSPGTQPAEESHCSQCALLPHTVRTRACRGSKPCSGLPVTLWVGPLSGKQGAVAPGGGEARSSGDTRPWHAGTDHRCLTSVRCPWCVPLSVRPSSCTGSPKAFLSPATPSRACTPPSCSSGWLPKMQAGARPGREERGCPEGLVPAGRGRRVGAKFVFDGDDLGVTGAAEGARALRPAAGEHPSP